MLFLYQLKDLLLIIIMIVAHPDDETLWERAYLMKDGYYVICLTNKYNSKRQNIFTNNEFYK